MNKKSQRSRQAIMDAAVILLASNPGAAFMEVAEVAGIGRATLYRHFPTKEDLIKAITIEAIEATDEVSRKIMSLANNASEALKLTIEMMVPMGDRYHFLSQLPSIDDAEINAHMKRQNNELITLIMAVQQEQRIDRNLPTSWACSVFNSLIYAAWEEVAKGETPKQEIAELVYRTLINGLAPQKTT